VDLPWTLRALADFRRGHATPVVLFTYLNPVLHLGLRRFLDEAAEAGANGVLLTDLPVGAAPELERASVIIEEVKRGEMKREVRSIGTLVPEDQRLVPALTAGRVERVLVRAGTVVEPGTVLATPATDGRTLYFATMRGHIVAVDLAAWTIKWDQPAGDAVYGAPALVGDTLFVLARDGRLCVFLPPLKDVEHAVDLLAAIEQAADHVGRPVVLEGYLPPSDPRFVRLAITPDPGVIEVNVPPASSVSSPTSIRLSLDRTRPKMRRRAEINRKGTSLSARFSPTGSTSTSNRSRSL
jgi:hypothetical protein